MRSRKLAHAPLFIALFVVLSAVAFSQDAGQDAWNFPDLSGMQVFVSHGREMSSKIYRAGTAVRVENSPKLATLYVPASSKVYKLTEYPDGSRSCVVMRDDQAKMLPSPLEVLLGGKNLKRTPAGNEVFEGHSCKVENVEITKADGNLVQAKVWEADDLKGTPVKIEMDSTFGKLQAVYRDLSFNDPDKALFTPPDKCIPYEKMGEVAEQKTIPAGTPK